MSQPPKTHRWLHPLLWCAGTLALLLGIVGIVVPGLPTTPFVLLAGACYVRVSPRAHAWLLRNRTFGPILLEWDRHHSVAPRVKRIAFAAMALTAGFSIWYFSGSSGLQGLVLGAMLVGAFVVWRLPSRQD
jgi:uncharacterized membrane protein YbaN (DUF454 family)